uniref:Gag-pol polyprotein n=1 Tax=Solanum tuberosum TaxID=4113 RepID=M1DZL9_SOLTU
MSVKEYALKFSQLAKYAQNMVVDSREMDISRLMIHAQQIEEEKLKKREKESKRGFREKNSRENRRGKIKIRRLRKELIADFIKDLILRVEFRSENELRSSTGLPGVWLVRRAPIAPGRLGRCARNAPEMSPSNLGASAARQERARVVCPFSFSIV